VTEIPEHLLKRSQSARAKADGGEAPASSNSPAPVASTPAVAAAAAPVAAAPVAPVAKPDLPVVTAYKKRHKIPSWAMLTLSILPVWLFLYVRAMEPVVAEAAGPLGEGTKVYLSACSGCHGAGGEGVGSAYGFTNGSVMNTFPHIEDQLRWVYLGTKAYLDAGVSSYGSPDREGGARVTGASGGQMPGWKGNLTDYEILASICHERYDLGGAAPEGEEFEMWCSPESEIYLALEEGTATFENLHEIFADKGVMEIGSTPVAGSPAE
jgi:mono/diheme cytochrome c family protein